jgi:hypothetical protein
MAAANALTLAWKPKTPDPVANEISAPAEGWDPAAKPAPTRPAQPRPRGA